ncbi:MAG: aldose 1-epimerase family protein [Eubacteriales bacterium]
MKYTMANTDLKVLINSKGAEIQSITDKDGMEYLWQGDAAYWKGQAPNLFPFIGRLTEGQYSVANENYKMPNHGFMKLSEFQVKEQKEDKIVFSLNSNEVTKEQYPFDFEVCVVYQLEGKKIGISYVVENTGDTNMYFAIGGHPGFNIPLDEAVCFEDYYLEFSAVSNPKLIGLSDDCYVTGNDVPYALKDDNKILMQHNLFDRDAIVLKEMCKEVTLKSDKGNRQVTVTYPDMNYLGIWHMPKTDAPYVCIEPWTSLPSRKDVIEDLQTKEDMIELPAEEMYVNAWQIEIK